MKIFRFRYYGIIFSIALMTGCATQGTYLRLDPSLGKDIKSFSGVQYVPLAKVCDFYGLECRWDSFVRTATIKKNANSIVLRSGSDRILADGVEKRLDKPIVLSAGAVFVPVSFVNDNLGLLVGTREREGAPPQPEVPKRFAIKAIVLDAGHGGRDVGATGRRLKLKEKEMTLSLARRIRNILEREGIRVIMTRDSDVFIPLSRRAEIANSSKADLFVSIHINASRARSMRGFECYYLSDATDDNARALEAFENASLKLDEEASLERSSQLDKTLWDMTLTENRLESAELASHICDSIERNFTMRNKGIRSARFYVLKYTHIPAVLVEAGYISNKYEEMKLKDPNFLDRIADAVAEGILRYKREYEKTEGYTR